MMDPYHVIEHDLFPTYHLPPLPPSSSSSTYMNFQTLTLRRNIIRMGIDKELIRPGSGPKPTPGQTVTVHCTGFGKNRDLNQKFWSTKDPGQQPFTFQIGQGKVIKGWDEGVLGMQLGEVARLKCSPDYAYGAGGFPAWGIQPNSELLFEIEVLGVK